MIKRITISDLAIMVKNGFDSIEERMATKEDLKLLETSLRKNLTQTIYTEIGKVNLMLDNIALRSEVTAIDKRVTKLEKQTN